MLVYVPRVMPVEGGGERQIPWDWNYRQLGAAMRILGTDLLEELSVLSIAKLFLSNPALKMFNASTTLSSRSSGPRFLHNRT